MYEPYILYERALHPAFCGKSSADVQKRPRIRDLQKRSMSDEKRLTKEERWGAGVEYHFQEFNEPYARRKWYLTTGRRAH